MQKVSIRLIAERLATTARQKEERAETACSARRQENKRKTYICQLCNGVGFDVNVSTAELLAALIDAGRDVLGLGGEEKEREKKKGGGGSVKTR